MSTNTQKSRKLSPLTWIGGGIVALAVLVFAVWTISPLFVNRRVDEAFPVAAPTAAAATSAPAVAVLPAVAATNAPATSAPATTIPAPSAPAVVATSLPAAVAPTDAVPTTAPTAAVPTTAPTVAPTSAPPTVAPTVAPAEPVALTSGSFTQLDALHGAMGNATIYRLPDGQLLLRLENFDAQNGPDLRVGLSGHAMPRSSAETHDNGYIELAVLKANQGNQNYALPADLDLGAYKSVVIYCKAFNVVFSTATLAGT